MATLRWNGQSTLAPSLSTVYLQAFNRTLSSWVNVTSNNLENANTDFDLNGTLPTNGYNLSDFKDSNGYIACRVYQEVVV